MTETQQPSWQIVLHDGKNETKTIPLEQEAVTIGQEADNDIQLDDEYISRHHLRLTQQEGLYIIEDLGSANGTFINDNLLTRPYILHPGDLIGLGPFTLRVEETTGQISPGERPTMAPSSRNRKNPLRVVMLLTFLLITMLLVCGFSMYIWLLPLPTPEMVTAPEPPAATEAVAIDPTTTPLLPTATPPLTPTATNTPLLVDPPTTTPRATATPLQAPQISLNQAPVAGSTLPRNEPVVIQAVINDPNGVQQVRLFINGEQVDEVVSPSLPSPASMTASFLWTPANTGTYTLTITADNDEGLQQTQTIDNITISLNVPPSPTATLINAAPSPTITTPSSLTVAVPLLYVRSGPGTAYPTVGGLELGNEAAIVGQATSTEGAWWQIEFSFVTEGVGWVSAAPELVTATNTAAVSTVVPPPVPSPTPTPATPTPPMPTPSGSVLLAPEGQTLLIAENRSLTNQPALLTLSGGRSVGGGEQLDVPANGDVRITLEPDAYRALWSSPARDGFTRGVDFEAVPGKVMVMWIVPEEGRTDIETYDRLSILTPNQPLPTPTVPPQIVGYLAPAEQALFVAANRSVVNAFSLLTISGGSFGGGQEFTLDAGSETPLELAPGDYRVIWSTPVNGGFTAGHEFSVVTGEVVLSWIVPEDGTVFMQFPNSEPIQVNN